MSEEQFLKLLGKITEISERTARIEGQVDGMQDDLVRIKLEDDRQNALLAEHIAGVLTNSQRLDNEITARKEAIADYSKAHLEQLKVIDKRLKEAEFLPSFFASARKITIWLGGFAGAVVAITKFFDMW